MAPRKPAAPTYKAHPALAAYIDRIGAEELNFRRFVVKDYKGNYYIERSVVRIVDGAVVCDNSDYAPTKEEAQAIAEELKSAKFPKSILATKAHLTQLKRFARGDLYELIDRKSGNVCMVQERIVVDGQKKYLPWTFWSDGQWRRMEPDGLLPFWKPRKPTHPKIMVHEGAKSAKFVHELVSDKKECAKHPWGETLAEYEHWGMIGGALVPHRTNYDELRAAKPSEVVYVCDNDNPGKSVLQQFSRHYGGALKGVYFSPDWPLSWDLADPMPAKFFVGSKKRYVGPQLRAMMRPATFATTTVPTADKKKTVIVLTTAFKEEWWHSVQPEAFIHKDDAGNQYTAREFNNVVAPFSDAVNTALELQKANLSKSVMLQYAPGREPGIYSEGHINYLNTHLPSAIQPEQGDASPWLDFVANLVPTEPDRTEVLRWCATLIARPDLRMHYGLLLISEQQGVGKGTLGEKILTPLVGEHNVSFPSEQTIVDSNYNYWLAHKRLAVVHEIYAGHSSKAYDSLKSVITDKHTDINKKYMASYRIDNWVHIFACSNSLRAIKLTSDDRRWLVPRVTETKRPATYWVELNRWLTEEAGLGIIRQWAQDWLVKNQPVLPGTDAPWTTLKRDVVEAGYSPGQRVVADKLETINRILQAEDEEARSKLKEWESAGYANGHGVFVTDQSLVQLIKDTLYDGRHTDRLESPLTIRKLAKASGWHIGEERTMIKDWAAPFARMIGTTSELVNTKATTLAAKGLRPLDLNTLKQL